MDRFHGMNSGFADFPYQSSGEWIHWENMDQIDIGLLMGCSDSQIPWFVYPTRFVINMVLTWLFSSFWNANF